MAVNAITTIGTPAARPAILNRFRDAAVPGEGCIPVTINGVRVLVYHQQGRTTWCHIQDVHGVVQPGMRASEAMPGSLFGDAARHADALLAGLRQAGEYPAAPAMPGWRFPLLCTGFAILAFVVMWAVIAAGFWMERQQ